MNATPPCPSPNRPVDTSGDSPKAPPGAKKLQLELWRRVLSHRRRQIETLSPLNFQLYVDIIALDLKTSRFKQVDGGAGIDQRRIDLAKGYYSSYLIYQHPPPSFITAQDVAYHMLALFYHSIDERLSSDERKYGLDGVKRSFSYLDKALEDQSLNSSNIQREDKAHGQSNDKDGNKNRTELPPNSDSSSTQKSDVLKNKSVPPRNNPSISGKVQKVHDMNGINKEVQDTRKEPPLTLDPSSAMENQTQHSSNAPVEQIISDNEGGEKMPKDKRQRAPPNVRDVPKERVEFANEPDDQSNDNEKEEKPKSKRSRSESAPDLDADDASRNQSQHSNNTQEKQKEIYKEGEEKKESNGKRQRKDPPLPAITNDAEEEKHDSDAGNDSVIEVIKPATSGPISGNKQTEGTVCTSANAYLCASGELYPKCDKGKLIQSVLARWWYAYQWPDPNALTQSIPKAYDALDGFPGVYICTQGSNVGKFLDKRDHTQSPSFNNFAKKKSAELKDIILRAIEEQLKVLIEHEGGGTDTEKGLRVLKKWAKKLNCAKADKEAEKVLKKVLKKKRLILP